MKTTAVRKGATNGSSTAQSALYEATAQIPRLVIARETLLPRRVEETATVAA
jgi:hypothetical protein